MVSLIDAYCIRPQVRNVVSQSLGLRKVDLVEAPLLGGDADVEVLVGGFGILLEPSVGENGIGRNVTQVLLELEGVAVEEPHG